MSKEERDLEKFLVGSPWLRKWVHECVACHHQGHKPELKSSEFRLNGPAAQALRRLASELVLDEAGVCEQCRKAAGKASEPSPASDRLSPPRIFCDERQRLDATYMEALRSKQEVESQLCAQIVSPDSNVKRQAKNKLKRAEKYSSRFLMDLMAHIKKHGCGS